MAHKFQNPSGIWLLAGVVVGLGLAMLVPSDPIEAVATDRLENFAICTGPVDEDSEAVYTLDFVSGKLQAKVISPVTGQFFAQFEREIAADFQLQPGGNPRYVMVTGLTRLRRQPGNVQPGRSAIYVAELTSGLVAAYAVPWSQAASTSARPMKANLVRLDVKPFREQGIVRQQP